MTSAAENNANTTAENISSKSNNDTENADKRTPWDGDTVSVGAKNQPAFYVRMVKRLLSDGGKTKIELQGRGEMGIMRVTQVQNILTRFGYCELLRMKTGPYPALSVHLKKAETFDDRQAAFLETLEEKAAERRRKAAEQEEEAAAAEDAEAKQWKEDTDKAT